MFLLAQGLIIGISVSAPVGPIGALCISRTLEKGRLSGFFSGLGAACADTCFAIAAALGVGLVESLLNQHQSGFRIIGGLILLAIGLRTLRAKPTLNHKNGGRLSKRGLIGDFISTFFLTLTNPMTVLFFAAVFSALGLKVTGGGWRDPAILISGVFIGSCGWWLFLSLGVGLLGAGMSPSFRLWMNRIAGMVVMGFGVVMLLAGFFN